MNAERKAMNPQILLEFICYVTFGGFIGYLVFSGQYRSYVTPRMVPYFYFTAAVMAVWALAALFRLFQPQYKTRTAHCFVLLIPVLILLLPHTQVDTSELSAGYLANSAGATGGQAKDATAPGAADTAQTEKPEAAAKSLPGLDEQNRRITVSNEDFGNWITEFYTNIEKYNGYTVVMTGFVYKDPEMMDADQFVPARLMMSCCVADLSPVGLLCKYDKVAELKKDSWVTVEGTLFIGKYKSGETEQDDPQLLVKNITPAQKVDAYVYP